MCHPLGQNFFPIKHAPRCTFQDISQGATESHNEEGEGAIPPRILPLQMAV